ncbi:hypothetical protein Glove_345g19 [Diversispora epigaea]|uniref:Uncharacterized protein n=1 Tax=Diversispora epigaea TaxID=1348612 RepID=A0A397HFG9_9GLOM|nr:hypothetical protein Glove_345g19 [Diversispora epigaea]
MKPDFTIKTTSSKQHIELLIGKVNLPKKKDVLILEDLVMFGKMMKCTLDKSPQMVILGKSLFDGSSYDGIYRVILIGEFELPRSSTSCFEVLSNPEHNSGYGNKYLTNMDCVFDREHEIKDESNVYYHYPKHRSFILTNFIILCN